MKTQVLVYNTTTALGADCTVVNGQVFITGSASGDTVNFDQDSLLSFKSRQVRVAGTLQVSTGVITAANSTTYQVVVECTNKITGTPQDFAYDYVSDASATAAEICAAFVAAINADPRISVTATNVANDLVLTADAPYYTFVAKNGNPNGSTIAFTTGTAGVIGVGTGSLVLNTAWATSDVVSTNNYTSFVFEYESKKGLSASDLKKETQVVVVLVNEAATNYESFAGAYGTLTQMLEGVVATWSVGTGTLAATAATDLLTLAGGGEFTTQSILAGDVLVQDGETTYYPVNTVLTVTTGLAIVGADNAAAAYNIIKLR